MGSKLERRNHLLLSRQKQARWGNVNVSCWELSETGPPSCLRLSKVGDLHSASGGKRGRREGNRPTSVGQQSKGPLPSSPWLPCGVTEDKQVSLAVSQNEATGASRGSGSQRLANAGASWGQSLQKDTVDLCQKERQASSMHVTKKLQAYVGPTLTGKVTFPPPLPQPSTEFRVRNWNETYIWSEENCILWHTQPCYCKVYTHWTNNHQALTMCQKLG